MSAQYLPPDHEMIQRYINNRISDIEKHNLHKNSPGSAKQLLEIIDLLKQDIRFPIPDNTSNQHPSPLSLKELDEILIHLYSGSMPEARRLAVLNNLFQSPITLDKLWIKSSQLALMETEPAGASGVESVIRSNNLFQHMWFKAAAIVFLFCIPGIIVVSQLAQTDGPPSLYDFANKLPHPITDDTNLGSTSPKNLFDQLQQNYKDGLKLYKDFRYADADKKLSKMVNNIPLLAANHSNPLNKYLYRNYYFYLAMSKMAHSQMFEYRSQNAINVLQAAFEKLEMAETYTHQDVGEIIDREIYYQGMILFFMNKVEEAKDKLSRIDSSSPYFQKKIILLRNFRE